MTSLLRRALAVVPWAFVGVVVLCAAPDALACPSCVDPTQKNRDAFVWTTAFLSLLPIVAFVGAAFWMRRMIKKAAENQPTL